MKRRLGRYVTCAYGWIDAVIDPRRLLSIPQFARFVRDWHTYRTIEGAEPIHLLDTFPRLQDKTRATGYDRHYFYQDIWAFRRILESKVVHHVDVGSRIDFVGMLSAAMFVAFVDLRPLEVNLERLKPIKGTILDLPFRDHSVQSLSCLHVAEHIGLGRYGDPLDPRGTFKAAQELSRVLAKDGRLYFSVPVGKPRLCFNAHRVHSPQQIIQYFGGLRLVEFSGIDDDGVFQKDADLGIFGTYEYACGLFLFS